MYLIIPNPQAHHLGTASKLPKTDQVHQLSPLSTLAREVLSSAHAAHRTSDVKDNLGDEYRVKEVAKDGPKIASYHLHKVLI
jgi:hypothetical protein